MVDSLAGLVVMALGVVTMALVASYNGDRHGVGPCALDPDGAWYLMESAELVDDEFWQSYAPRLDVDFGETAKLTLTLRNTRDEERILTTTRHARVTYVVTARNCAVVWRSPSDKHAWTAPLQFGPGEERMHTGEWSLTDNGGAMVDPPGEYFVHAIVDSRGSDGWDQWFEP